MADSKETKTVTALVVAYGVSLTGEGEIIPAGAEFTVDMCRGENPEKTYASLKARKLLSTKAEFDKAKKAADVQKGIGPVDPNEDVEVEMEKAAQAAAKAAAQAAAKKS